MAQERHEGALGAERPRRDGPDEAEREQRGVRIRGVARGLLQRPLPRDREVAGEGGGGGRGSSVVVRQASDDGTAHRRQRAQRPSDDTLVPGRGGSWDAASQRQRDGASAAAQGLRHRRRDGCDGVDQGCGNRSRLGRARVAADEHTHEGIAQ